MRRHRVGLVGVLVAGLGVLGACLTPAATTCEDGTLCSAGQVCAPAGGGCVDPAQVEACVDVADGEACELAGIGTGTCVDRVCVLGGCGNGAPDAGEVCDDGNTTSGDGCRADCAKVEVCGDAVVDAGEACDDGNGNPADGCDACVATAWRAEALLAGAEVATDVALTRPHGVAVDVLGNLYIADTNNHRLRRVAAGTGQVTTVAGTGVPGFSGDGGPATSAQLASPRGVAVDGLGNVYIADADNHRIRRVAAGTGQISTIAGTGAWGFGGDGGPATSAMLAVPYGVAVDGLGSVYIVERLNHRVRRVAAGTGLITTVAGTGVIGGSGDGGAATSAQLSYPEGVAVDGLGNVYIADSQNHRIRQVAAETGLMSTLAGTGTYGFGGDGGAATDAELAEPRGVAVDVQGNVYVADTENYRLRRVSTGAGLINSVAGTGTVGSSGDGGPATAAQLRYPRGVAVDGLGNVYIVDIEDHRVRRVAAGSELMSTVAGTGAFAASSDGGSATSAPLAEPEGVAVDAQGNVYIADTSNHHVRRVEVATGVVSTVAGTGVRGESGDGGPASSAELAYPSGVAVDGLGNVYIADRDNSRIRRVAADTGLITTVAGTGDAGGSGDGGPAISAQLGGPQGVAVDGEGNVYIADTNNNRIRRVDVGTGLITTVAGTGDWGFGGDGGLATSAELRSPYGVAVDAQGDVYVADTSNYRIRRVAVATGLISTVVGTGGYDFGGDGGPATSAQLTDPTGVAVDGLGNLYIADYYNHRIRRVAADTGLISTVAGTGANGFGGDGGLATSAQLSYPAGVAVDGLGNVYLADYQNDRVRRVAAGTGLIATAVGAARPAGEGPEAQATLATPAAVVLAGGMTLFAGGTAGVVQALRDADGWLETVTGRYPHDVATGDLAAFRTNSFGSVGGVAYDATTGRIFLTEGHVVHVVTTDDAGAGITPADEATWTIAVLAGAAFEEGAVDGTLATARFRAPTGLFFAAATGVLYVADTGNHTVRAIDLDAGTVSTVAGTAATLGFFGDDGAATDALLYAPTAVTLAPSSDLFIADSGNHRVRRVEAGTQVITTVLGDGVAASSGEGAPAWAFPVDDPQGLACDARGNLFVTSSTTVRLVPATDAGLVDGSGVVLSIYGAAPRDTFPAAATSCLTGVAVVDDETTWVTDRCAGLLVELWRQPIAP